MQAYLSDDRKKEIKFHTLKKQAKNNLGKKKKATNYSLSVLD